MQLGNDVDNGPKYKPDELNAPMATNLSRNVDRRTGYPWKSLRFVVVIIYISLQAAAVIYIVADVALTHETSIAMLCECLIKLLRRTRTSAKNKSVRGAEEVR